MTNREASCPECGHSPLSHKKGVCLAIVTVPNRHYTDVIKAHCGCNHYKPLDAIQMQLRAE